MQTHLSQRAITVRAYKGLSQPNSFSDRSSEILQLKEDELKGEVVVTGMGKFLQEKLGCRRETDMPCPQEHLPSPVKFAQAQQKAQIPAQAGPSQGHPFNSRAPCCKGTKSHQQAAGFAARALQVLEKSKTRTDNAARRLQCLRSNSSTRNTSNPGPIGRLWPMQALGKISASIKQM